MSEQEKKSGGTTESSVVLVEQSATSRHKHPFRPIDMQEDVPKELQHKRSKAPAVPSVTEEFKDSHTESKGKIECERAMSSEKHKHVAKKLSSITKRRASSPEGITLAPMIADMKKEPVASSQPIPAPVPQTPEKVDQPAKREDVERKDDEDSITEDIAELRTPEMDKAPSEWSDEEQAGGLPRSESRASRMSRAVRQLFCCGMPLEPPSEYNMSPRTEHDAI